MQGAIPVAADMSTARDALLAAGDVCMAENTSARRALRVEHWGDALAQGAIAGKTAAGVRGQDVEEETVQWTILLASISRWMKRMFAFSIAKA